MINNEKAAQGVSGTQSGYCGTTAGITSLSISEYSTGKEARQERGEAYLRERGHIGRQCAISREALVEQLKFENVRSLRAEIARERKRGSLILSSTQAHGGYFLPSDGEQGRQELLTFVQSCHNRAVNVFSISKAARQALQIDEGQLSFDNTEKEGGDGECGTSQSG